MLWLLIYAAILCTLLRRVEGTLPVWSVLSPLGVAGAMAAVRGCGAGDIFVAWCRSDWSLESISPLVYWTTLERMVRSYLEVVLLIISRVNGPNVYNVRWPDDVAESID